MTVTYTTVMINYYYKKWEIEKLSIDFSPETEKKGILK